MGLIEGAVELVAEDLVGAVISPPVLAIGALLAVPVVAPHVSKELRPLTKRVVKGGLMVFDKGKEIVIEVGEQWSDIVAESRAELAAAEAAAVASAPAGQEKTPEVAEVSAEVEKKPGSKPKK